MARRIVRTAIQATVAVILFSVTIFFLDRNFRVLPKSIHAYLPQHHQGHVVTDLTIVQCSSLNPFSSCELDSSIWQRVNKDLYLGKGWVSTAYLYVRRTKQEDISEDDMIVLDIAVGKRNPAEEEEGEPDQNWERRQGGLWLHRVPRKEVDQLDDGITAVDVLFGSDAVEVREGWDILDSQLLLDSSPSTPVAYLTTRTGHPEATKKPVPRINDNGKFKIVQVSDLHLSTGVGECRDAIPNEYNGGECEADPRALDFVNKILDEEKPDLIVFSGDQVNGNTAPDAQTPIFKYAQLAAKRKIPFVSIFGNHDDEKTVSREAQMSIIETLPYSLSMAGPDEVSGVGNYYVEVLARGHSDHSALTLYMLDTHSYSPNEKKFPGYDWLKPNQIEWFKNTAQGLRPAHKEYTHIHMDLAFIHIPIPEYIGVKKFWKGEWRELVTAPVYNSGFRDALVEQGIVMVSCGHDHVNDYCMLSTDDQENPSPALWMCYAGGSGLGGYAGYGGYNRRVRVFDVDANLSRITTWKRIESGTEEETAQRVDEQVIVEGGHVIGPTPEEEEAAASNVPPWEV